MRHSQHEYEQLTVVDLIDDPIVTGADPPFTRTAYEALGGGRSWLLGQELEHRLDATADCRVERAKFSSS